MIDPNFFADYFPAPPKRYTIEVETDEDKKKIVSYPSLKEAKTAYDLKLKELKRRYERSVYYGYVIKLFDPNGKRLHYDRDADYMDWS